MNSRCGEIAVVGRPNVGKSTLMNCLIGAHVGITSSKPQTTRSSIRGILTEEIDGLNCQLVFVDTPGVQSRYRSALNRLMNRSVTLALAAVDVALFVVDHIQRDQTDQAVARHLPEAVPVIAVINKIDRLTDKRQLLPRIEQLAQWRAFAAIVPLAAERGDGALELKQAIARLLPQAPHRFERDAITDRSERHLAAELLRESLFRQMGEELPYGLAVVIEKFETEGRLRRIHAAIWVDKPAHKAMIIGKAGEKMKRIASSARRSMEELFGGNVWLESWVKVKHGWADDERLLRSLGFD